MFPVNLRAVQPETSHFCLLAIIRILDTSVRSPYYSSGDDCDRAHASTRRAAGALRVLLKIEPIALEENMASLAEEFLNDVDSPASEERETNEEEDVPSSNSFKPEDKITAQPDLPNPIPMEVSNLIASLLAKIGSSSSAPQARQANYTLVTDCLNAITSLNELITVVFERLKKAFAPRFPELETLIFHPLDFARVARLSADKADLTSVDLRSVLPSGTVIIVQLAFSSTAGKLLSAIELRNVYALCDALTTLDEWHSHLFEYVEARAEHMAPNLVAIVGGAVAARLMALSGGLKPLATMPSCNVKLLGKRNAPLQGTSSATTRQHEGVLFTCPLVTSLPKSIRSKAGEVVSGKACLAARVDACRGSEDGSMGRGLREGLEAKFAKWLEPHPARTAKPLPVPGDEAKRRHRGGRRARKEKQRLGITDIKRLANRVQFGQEEAVIGNDFENEGFGMLGKEGSGRLRLQAKKTDTVSIAAKRRLEKQKKRDARSEADVIGITGNGVIAPDDTIELRARPAVHQSEDKSKTANYFSVSTPFIGVKEEAHKQAKIEDMEVEERDAKKRRLDTPAG